MLDRLHKILARAGVAALRPAEDLILQGRVTVNGRVVRELGARADADTDVIAVNGQIVHVPPPAEPHRYLMLHKPVGVISTARDTHDRPAVVDLVPNDVRVFPVGRLDADSEGLLLLTDDGDLAYRLTHPRFAIDKEYRVLVDRAPAVADLRQWRSGVTLPDGHETSGAWVEVLERGLEGAWLRIVMREGHKRQIREAARTFGLNVLRLIRVREGTLVLGDLAPGAWRELTQNEIEALRAHTQHVPSREADEQRGRVMSEEDPRRPRRLRVVRRPREETSLDAGEQSRSAAAPELDGTRDVPPRERDDRPADARPRTRFDTQSGPEADRQPPAERPRGRFGDEAPRPERGGRSFDDRSGRAAEPRRAPPPRGPAPRSGAGGGRPGDRSFDREGRGGAPPSSGFGRGGPPSGGRGGPRRDDNRGFSRGPGAGGNERGFGRGAPERGFGSGGDDRRGPQGQGFGRGRPGDEGRSFERRDPPGRQDYGNTGGQRGDIRGGLGGAGNTRGRGAGGQRGDLRGGLGGGGTGGPRGRAGGQRGDTYRSGGGGRWNDQRGPAPRGRRDDDAPEINGNVREDFDPRDRPRRSFNDRGSGRPAGPPRGGRPSQSGGFGATRDRPGGRGFGSPSSGRSSGPQRGGPQRDDTPRAGGFSSRRPPTGPGPQRRPPAGPGPQRRPPAGPGPQRRPPGRTTDRPRRDEDE